MSPQSAGNLFVIRFLDEGDAMTTMLLADRVFADLLLLGSVSSALILLSCLYRTVRDEITPYR